MANGEATDLSQKIKFNQDGLVAAIAVDDESGLALMQAWMNAEALQITLRERAMCYYSRSRQKLWRKGEVSGNQQKLISIYLDCDGDCLLARVQQVGAACHTGRANCFFYEIDPDTQKLTIKAEPIQDATMLYGDK